MIYFANPSRSVVVETYRAIRDCPVSLYTIVNTHPSLTSPFAIWGYVFSLAATSLAFDVLYVLARLRRLSPLTTLCVRFFCGGSGVDPLPSNSTKALLCRTLASQFDGPGGTRTPSTVSTRSHSSPASIPCS